MGSFTEVPAPFGDTLGCVPTAGRCVGWLLVFSFLFSLFFLNNCLII